MKKIDSKKYRIIVNIIRDAVRSGVLGEKVDLWAVVDKILKVLKIKGERPKSEYGEEMI